MEAQDLKERIIEDEKIELILEELEMHSIKLSNDGRYYSCGMPDGNNKKSTIIYINNLHVDAYTRNIKDAYGGSDIISLVSFINGTYFSESIKWICDICGYDYYGNDKPKSIFATWVRDTWKMNKEKGVTDDQPLKPIDEYLLSYYGRYVHPLFYQDGIDYETQYIFELGYDLDTHTITIPIRDELGFLVGIKARLNKKEVKEWESKYFYIEKCAKSKILFGLDKTKKYIRERNEVIVVESEKSVMQLWSMGYRNAVAIGGHILSDTQVKKLTHLNCDIVLALDEGVDKKSDGTIDKNFYKGEFNKFLDNQTLYCVFDNKRNILNKKESPSDNHEKWELLYKNKFKIKG